MDTFSAEDILIDNLSFNLNKGASYINERRSVSFFPSGSNTYKSSPGNRVLKIALNAEDNSWLDQGGPGEKIRGGGEGNILGDKGIRGERGERI